MQMLQGIGKMLGIGQGSGVQGGVAQGAVIGKAQIEEAATTLQKYKSGKQQLESRIKENEDWWQLNGYKHSPYGNDPNIANKPIAVTGWLINTIQNKHADAMDNYPEPIVLPREETDEPTAEALGTILPVALEQNDFESVYSDAWWYKLKSGTAVYQILWDKSKYHGLGDVGVRSADILNLFWEPGITDIQKSKNLFHVEMVDTDTIKQRYPQVKDSLGGTLLRTEEYNHTENIDNSNKLPVIDWYYKRYVQGKGEVLHFCKFVNNTILFASENDPQAFPDGYYGHGLYPFVFDTLFPVADMPTGYGYIDIIKNPQKYIDMMASLMLENAMVNASKRYFVGENAGINEAEYADTTKKFVHVSGAIDARQLQEIQNIPLGSDIITLYQMKIDEMKEVSGNRDFNQGGATGGVSAASAIAMLQEAGNKLARDMIKTSYRSFTQVCNMVIELMRQFYDIPRTFRIIGDDGKAQYQPFDNSQLVPQQITYMGIDLGTHLPVFDLKVKAQKANPYNQLAQNTEMKDMFQLGFFNPMMADQALIALAGMDFEGKDKVEKMIRAGQTMLNQLSMAQQDSYKLATIVDSLTGSNIAAGMEQAGMVGQQQAGMMPQSGGQQAISQNPMSAAPEAQALADKKKAAASGQTELK